MRKTLCLILLLISIQIHAQQDNAPVVGVSDKRVEVYGLKNARVVVDYQTTIENTDILISNGRIESIGSNLSFPKGTIIYDLTGKTVYPSFIDVYAGNYGIKTQTGAADANPYAAFMNPAQTGRSAITSTPEPRIADYWNDGVKKIVLTGADESAWAVKDFLKENNIPVILAHVHSLPKYEYSDIRLPFKLAAMFKNEGILIGLTYASQAYGFNLPFVAGQTVAYGLTKEEALQTITINNAKILGIDDKTGSLETGKDANIVVSTGDILDMLTNNIEFAFISGRNISLDNKHKQLYRRFQAKYENVK